MRTIMEMGSGPLAAGKGGLEETGDVFEGREGRDLWFLSFPEFGGGLRCSVLAVRSAALGFSSCPRYKSTSGNKQDIKNK